MAKAHAARADVPERQPAESPKQRRGEQAVDVFHEADKLDLLPREVRGDDEAYNAEAAKLRRCGQDLLIPSEPVAVGTGREAIAWDNTIGEASIGETARIIDTLEKHPHAVAVGASGQRTAALRRADVLEPALDAAESAQAANSIEKMLCHQMAAAHFTALRLLEKSAGERLQAGEVARFTNAAARMMDVYQNGCVTLQKMKAGGTQRVLVQYQQVNVGPGGQAIVADRISRGSRTPGRGRKTRE